MSNVIQFDFKKKERFTLCSCSFCGVQHKIYAQPDPRTPVIFMSKDHTSRICAHCIRILNSRIV